MKTFVVSAVAAVALLAVPAGLGATDPALTLSVVPSSGSAGDVVTFTGTYTSGSGSVGSQDVTILVWTNGACNGAANDTVAGFTTTYPSGLYVRPATIKSPPGTYSYRTEVNETLSNCASLTILAPGANAAGSPPPQPVSIFLCYSAFQDQPGVWSKDVAEQLLQQGYWLPYAVSGDSSGGTNLGGFHLSCNIAATQSVGDSFVGGDGTVLGPDYAGATAALYPKVGG